MQTSQQINELAAALALARKNFSDIPRDRTVKVTTDKGSYTFAYAPLETILAAITQPLAEQGLSLTQGVRIRGSSRGDDEVMVTRLIHASGQWIENETPIILGTKTGPQAYGSSLTYAGRYGVRSLLTLATDEDDDGNVATGNQIQDPEDQAERFPCSQPGCNYRGRQPWPMAHGTNLLNYGPRDKWYCGTHWPGRTQKPQEAPGSPNVPKLVETPERRFKRLLVKLRELGWGEVELTMVGEKGDWVRTALLSDLLEDQAARQRLIANKLLDGDWLEAADKLDVILKEQVGEGVKG